MASNPEQEINRLNESIRQTIELLAQLKQASIASRGGIASDQEIAELERLNKLLVERNRLRQGGSTTGTTIHTPAGPAPSPTIEPPAGVQNISYRTKADRAADRELRAKERAAVAEEKRAKKAEEAAAKEAELVSLRNKVETEAVYRNALQQAQARGLGSQDLQRVIDRGGGIQNLKFARTDASGIEKQFNPYVNTKTGSSTPGLSSQFRTFGSDILRDIGQFTKWSIAIAAVYTPLQKLGELMTIMVDNESRLADATIAANVPFSKSGQIFDTVAVSANKAGESINTTIDAYTQAIRAAGRYNDEGTKQVAAVKLLDDSLILSKLSTLDQAGAIDTLSAALLQSDRSLVQGEELLNKWVRVSQIANVDITALATGVAVLGDSAETVGLSIDQLNGLIAVLSEQSISGAKEAANTAKALVGAYQSDKAEAALNKYGIALRKTNGEVRGFLEIYQELAKLRQEGVLSESAVSEIALALGGGGVRRAKDASALINSTDRLNKIAAESAKITGADSLAKDALSKKLETVQTANTRLANSFQELAQTLGTDGGLLDDFKVLVNLLTSVTKASGDLFSLLGRSGPLLATFVAGMVALQATSGSTKATLLAQLGTGNQFKGFLGGSAQFGGPPTGGKGILADILQMNTRGGLLLGGAGTALQAGTNLAAGKNENALGNVAGGIVGGIAGSLGGPVGIAIGANIGSAVGDAFVTAVDKHSEQLADYFLPKTADKGKVTPAGEQTYRGKSTQELLDTAYNSLGFFGKIQSYLKSTTTILGGKTIAPEYQNKESAGMDILKTKNPALYKELFRQFQSQQAQLSAQTAISNIGTGGNTEALRKQLEQQGTQARQYQLGQLATGKITSAEFGRVSNQISGFPAASIKSVTAFGDEVTKVNRDIQNTTEAYNAFLYIAQYGTQDQINLISQYSDDILTLQSYLKKLKEEPALVGAKVQLSFGDITIESPEQLAKLISDLQKQGSTALGVTLQQTQASQSQAVKLPTLVGDYNKPLTGKSQDIVVQKGLAIQEKYLVETGKTADEIAKFKAGIEAFYATVTRNGSTQFEAVDGLTQQFYDLGKAAAEAAGELENINQPIGFQKFDVGMPQLTQLAQQSLQIGQGWQKKFNYDYKPEDQIAIDNQGIVQPLHADFKILALLLEKLNEKAQKQLDGQYNIPEGATFWVPLTAAYYRNKDTGAGGANDLLAGLDLKDNTGATDQNTQALRDLTNKYQQGDQVKREYAPDYYRRSFDDRFDKMNPLKTTFHPISERTAALKDEVYSSTSAQKLPGGTPTFNQTGMAQLLTELKNLFSNLFTNTSGSQIRPGGLGGGGGSAGGAYKGASTTQVNTNPTTKLDLRLSSNVNLMVDGRVLATTLQSYLASELLRTESSQGTITKKFII
jgi:TP901 family phage tail tape measure protein